MASSVQRTNDFSMRLYAKKSLAEKRIRDCEKSISELCDQIFGDVFDIFLPADLEKGMMAQLELYSY